MSLAFRLIAIAFASAASTAVPSFALADESSSPAIFVAELRSIALFRPDWRHLEPSSDGTITISNSCGEETAVVRVIRSTAPVAAEQTLHFTMNEWCDRPIEFEHANWLIALSAAPGREPLAMPVFAESGVAFAVVRDQRELGGASLALEPLPQPVEYPYSLNLDSSAARRFIRSQTALEMREGRVWVVRGVLLATLFPGFSASDLD